MPSRQSSEPLIPRPGAAPGNPEEQDSPISNDHTVHQPSILRRARRHVQYFQTSRFGHYSILLLVALDVTCIFADLFVAFYLCDHAGSKRWGDAQTAFGIIGLVFSSLFVVELLLSIWAFGRSYFRSKFRVFDGTVIIVGFLVDVILRGVDEEIASLVVVLRLWRFFKIIEEMSAGAQEQIDAMESRMDELDAENQELKDELAKFKNDRRV